MSHIGTAPNQSLNVEYDVIGDPETVYCEDEQKEMPEADCRQIGELWYSLSFLRGFEADYEIAFSELERIGQEQDKFLRGDGLDIQRVRNLLGFLQVSLGELKRKFEGVAL